MNRSFLLALTLGGAALGSAGCQESWCDGYVACTETGSSGMGGSSTSSSASSTSTMMTSSSTGVVMDCVPTLTQGPKDDTCGVFVDPLAGSDGSDGTMAAPMKTLTAAIAEWTPGKAIYVCDGALTDASNVAVLPGVIAYGGLDCANAYRVKAANARTTLAPGPGVIPLTLTAGASPIAMQRFAVTAAAGVAAGASAIGVIIDDVPATLEDFEITAGDGVAGASSVTPTDFIGPSDPNDATIKGNAGANANTTTPTIKNPGGPAKVNPLCVSNGGSGGDGGEVVGTAQNGYMAGNGAATPAPTMGVGNGMGGAGDMGGGCLAGNIGRNGDPVLDGPGAAGAASIGTIAADGYHGVGGSPGANGNPGQGGGGGGGARGKTGPDTRGASGGSGGAGGCGGKGAGGGGAGGASIALVLLGATAPTLANVTLTTGKGGDGGAGAAGQSGAIGGDGGPRGLGTGAPATTPACIGGAGGSGGNGGAGGGGRGGHSLGIAHVSAAPSTGFMVTHGLGGAAGATVGTGATADTGIANDTQQLDAD